MCWLLFPLPYPARLRLSDSPQIFKLLGSGTNVALVNSVAVGVVKAGGVITGVKGDWYYGSGMQIENRKPPRGGAPPQPQAPEMHVSIPTHASHSLPHLSTPAGLFRINSFKRCSSTPRPPPASLFPQTAPPPGTEVGNLR